MFRKACITQVMNQKHEVTGNLSTEQSDRLSLGHKQQSLQAHRHRLPGSRLEGAWQHQMSTT